MIAQSFFLYATVCIQTACQKDREICPFQATLVHAVLHAFLCRINDADRILSSQTLFLGRKAVNLEMANSTVRLWVLADQHSMGGA